MTEFGLDGVELGWNRDVRWQRRRKVLVDREHGDPTVRRSERL
jgi:hypothetical protein